MGWVQLAISSGDDAINARDDAVDARDNAVYARDNAVDARDNVVDEGNFTHHANPRRVSGSTGFSSSLVMQCTRGPSPPPLVQSAGQSRLSDSSTSSSASSMFFIPPGAQHSHTSSRTFGSFGSAHQVAGRSR